MGWIGLISGLLRLVNFVAEFLSRKQLIDAGVAQAVAAGNTATLERIEKARKVKDALAADPDYARRMRDKYTRPDK